MNHDKVAERDLERWEAFVDQDVAVLNDLLHADLVYTHSNGSVDPKQSFLETLARGSFHYDEVRRTSHDVVHLSDQIAILTGRARVRSILNGSEVVVDLQYTTTWLFEASAWVLLASHSCIPA